MQKLQPGCHLPEDSTDTTLDNMVSLLALPEHHVCLLWDARQTYDVGAWCLFSFLNLEIICYKDMCKQRLDLIGREEATRAGIEEYK